MLTEGKGDIIKHIEAGKQRTTLKQQANALAQPIQPLPGKLYYIQPIDHHHTLLRFQLTTDQPQQRSLPGAAGSHDRGDLTALEADIDLIQDRTLTITECQVPKLDQIIALPALHSIHTGNPGTVTISASQTMRHRRQYSGSADLLIIPDLIRHPALWL